MVLAKWNLLFLPLLTMEHLHRWKSQHKFKQSLFAQTNVYNYCHPQGICVIVKGCQ